ncbi:MAG: MFS transporter [Verrucomicrobiota bacterium]
MCAVPTPHSKRSDVDRNWRIFLWFRVLFSARFYYPVMAVLFLDLGLTAIQYTLLNVAWAAASLLSDIPAGVLADRIGRKPLLVAAGCLMIAEMVILCLAPHNGGGVLFLFCLANRVLSGLAEGAASGADEAIVFDSLAESGREGEWHHVMEELTRWQSVSFVFVMLIGGAVYAPGSVNAALSLLGIHGHLDQEVTLRFPLVLTLLSAVAVFILALNFREPTRPSPHSLEDFEGHRASSALGAYTFTLRAGRWLLGNPMALFVVCAGFVLDCVVRLFLVFSTSYFRLIEIPEVIFGILGAAMGGIGLLVSPWIRRMVTTRSVGTSFAIMTGVVFLGLLGVAFHPPYWGIVFGYLLWGAMTMIGFSVSTYLNQLVDSHHRATVLSFKGVTVNLAYAGISLLFALALHMVPGSDAQEQLGRAFGFLPFWLLLTVGILIFSFRKHLRLLTSLVAAGRQ